MFIKRSVPHGSIHVRASRTIYVDKSVKYSGTLLWNQLRDNVKNSLNFNIFKKQLGSFNVVDECQLYTATVRICTPECIYVSFYYVFIN